MIEELFVVVGLVLDRKGNSIEWWIEGHSSSQDEADQYATRLNAVHEAEDEAEERVLYVVASSLDIRSSGVFDGSYDA